MANKHHRNIADMPVEVQAFLRRVRMAGTGFSRVAQHARLPQTQTQTQPQPQPESAPRPRRMDQRT